MEYSLKLNGKQDALRMKNLLISKNLKVSYKKMKTMMSLIWATV